ncbi:N-acetylmuramoyl-L-alanine amidase family protein [Butyrivibrio sp. AE3009]|uniref:N-acetylmuramoyl-L-alanine amidase family protein n=1 Tax=Butyrivibrio sp. AE3009 TaxID=1280666 RepID=UPI0003B672D4|nr:hypothetical protein [Butyrivibrio sp. AE3009]
MRKIFLTRLLAAALCTGLILQPVTAYASQSADEEITEQVVLEEVFEETAPTNLPAEPDEVRDPMPGVTQLPSLTGVRLEGNLLYWDPFPDTPLYWLDVGDKREYLSDESMPCDLSVLFHDTFKLDPGSYTLQFYAINWDGYRSSEVSELEYTYTPKKTPVKNVNITTNAKQLLIDGAVKRGPVVITTDNQALSVQYSYWFKVLSNGYSRTYDDSFFTPGTYNFTCMAVINDAYKDTFEIDENITITIDGVACTPYDRITSTENPVYFFRSGNYEVKEIPKINNLRVEGDLLYWDPVKDASSYRLDIGAHTNYLTEDDMPYNLKDAFSKTELISGDYTIYFSALNQNNERITNIYELNYTYNNRTLIDSISVSTDAKDLLKNGNARTKAKITNEENPEVTVNFYNWRKVSEDGTEKDFYDKTFTPGKYRFELAVYLNASYVDKYELDENTQLVIDGVAVKSHNQINSYGKYIMYFYSPYFEIEVQPEPVSGRWFVKYGATYYELSTGEPATGVLVIDGDYYLFNKRGVRQTATFYEDDGKTYYFGKDGKRITGWMTKWASTYYFDEDGVMQTGFTDIDGDTYYFKADGRQVHTAWITIADKKYYAKSDGKIAKSETITKWGKKYSFDADGVLISK